MTNSSTALLHADTLAAYLKDRLPHRRTDALKRLAEVLLGILQAEPLLTEELRYREPRRGSRWFLDEVCIEIGIKKLWLFLARTTPMTTLGRWRAVDDSGAVLDWHGRTPLKWPSEVQTATDLIRPLSNSVAGTQ